MLKWKDNWDNIKEKSGIMTHRNPGILFLLRPFLSWIGCKLPAEQGIVHLFFERSY